MDGELDDGVDLLVLVLHTVASQALVEAGLLLPHALQAEGGANTGQILTIQLSQNSVKTKFCSKEKFVNKCFHCTGRILANKGNVKQEISLIEKKI